MANPCAYYYGQYCIRLVVHGDDFLVTGRERDLHWLRDRMAQKFEIKTTIIGPASHQEKSLVMLNRTLRWTSHGLEWIPDERHIEQIVKILGLEKANGVAAPADGSISDIGVKREEELAIPEEEPVEVHISKLATKVRDTQTQMARVQFLLNLHITELQLRAPPSTPP